MMDDKLSNTLGKSPFDLPRNYNYDDVTEYSKNKAEQLLNIKNYDLALNEIKGLHKCSEQNNDINSSNKLKEKYLLSEELLLVRNKSRKRLAEFYNNDNLHFDYNIAIAYLNGFKESAKDTEEYFKLIEKIISFNLEKSKKENSEEVLKKTFELILTFDPLKYIIEEGIIELEKGSKPFMLFDLDSTLFDNSPRVHKIIQDFINDHRETYPDEAEKLSEITREDIVWGIKENLAKKGIHDEKIVKHIAIYWYERFFSNEYIIDVPLRGASQFIKDIEEAGIKVIYLTGRFESMREGTVRNILEYNFPLDQDSSNLILKPHAKISDEDFKHMAMDNVKELGYMVAGFENEPINANIFQKHFSESEIFFLETNHSLNPPNLMDTIHTIKNFEYLK